jgi:ABC-2 type transport system ATP-binding protein
VTGATVEVDQVSRWYGDVVALTRVTTSIGPGVTGLLGPNGAGKSSLIRILVGLQARSEGRVQVLGRDPRRDAAVRGVIGYVPEGESLPTGVTAARFVGVLARERGAPADAAPAAIASVGLDPSDARPLRTYSKGMRQRVKVAAALAHEPQVLVLDEPLNGLDPPQRRAMMDLFVRLGREGRTVIVSSHVLQEVERFSDRVVVLIEGRLAAEGPHTAIRDLMDDRPRRIRIRTDAPRPLGARLLQMGAVDRVDTTGGGEVEVHTADVGAFRDGIAAAARDVDARLLAVTPLDEDLDSVFTDLVRRGDAWLS